MSLEDRFYSKARGRVEYLIYSQEILDIDLYNIKYIIMMYVVILIVYDIFNHDVNYVVLYERLASYLLCLVCPRKIRDTSFIVDSKSICT